MQLTIAIFMVYCKVFATYTLSQVLNWAKLQQSVVSR